MLKEAAAVLAGFVEERRESKYAMSLPFSF
jgi:hypothetical protein